MAADTDIFLEHGNLGRPLAFEFFIAVLEDANEGAGAELVGDRSHVLKALGLAEGAEKASALYTGAAKQAPLGEDNGPGQNAESQQEKKNDFGDEASLADEVEQFAAEC